MRYPPNRDAAEWLACEIVPALRATHPGARVIIAGRGAAKLGQAPDIELLSDVPDLARLLRRARVAAVPLRSGTGTPILLGSSSESVWQVLDGVLARVKVL